VPQFLFSRSLIVAVVLCLAPAPAVSATTGTSAVTLGAYVSGAPWKPARLDRFARLVGRMPGIVMWYQDWGSPGVRDFNVKMMNAVVRRGATPMVTWDPWRWKDGPLQPSYAPARIAAGEFDAYIRRWGRAARSWGKTFYLRFAHEMNAAYYPWGVGNNGNTAADFVAAWRRVVGIFRREKATNVLFVWSPNVEFDGTAPFASVYPGSRHVDVIAVDGYNWGASVSWHSWQSFTGLFGASYDKLARLDARKPMMIAETASTELGGNKASWIRNAFLREIPARFPRIGAVIWFHEDKETDWRVNSSSAALAAYRKVVASSGYVSPTTTGGQGKWQVSDR
jgi:beta-mannanase